MKLFFTNFDYISGTLTSFIDLYYNLKEADKKFDVHFYTSNVKLLFNFFNKYVGRDYELFQGMTQNPSVQSDVIVSSTYIFTAPFLNQINIELECDHLIILDSLGFFQAQHNNYLSDYHQRLKTMTQKCSRVTCLANPFNLPFCKEANIEGLEYYHKFSRKRLNHLKFLNKQSQIDEPLHSQNYQNLKLSHQPVHCFNSYHYQRWYQIQQIYAENIGKLIFEYNWMQKPVYYSSQNKSLNDGLHYYLKLFNIDDSYDQTLQISPTEIEEKLFFHPNDLILELLP